MTGKPAARRLPTITAALALGALAVLPLAATTSGGPDSLPAAIRSPVAEPPRDARYFPRGYYSGDPLPPHTVYLTFDDGPCDFTGQILDILKQEGVRATFFLNAFDKDSPSHQDLGANHLLPYAAQLRRMVAAGHAIGNHTFSHRDLAALPPAGIDFQLDTLQRKLAGVLGAQTPVIHLIRPPFGSPWLGQWNSKAQQRKVAAELRDRGLVMMWTTGWDSSDSLEWVSGEWYKATSALYHPGGPKYQAKMQRQLDRIFKRADGTASGIILLHDVHPTSRDSLAPLIRGLKQRGYDFGTLEDYCAWRWGPEVFAAFDARAAAARPPVRF
jgi:peptidoglycan/xylan/chitin deacetylase (PgdA/CDA1 family)